MRFVFLLFVLLLTSNLYADDCRYEKIFNPESHVFQGCTISVATPSYALSAEIPAGDGFSELDCVFFCNYNTFIPFPHGDHHHVEQVPRPFVNQLLAIREQLHNETPPEIFLQEFMAAMMDAMNGGGGGQIPEELWNQHVQSMIHQKDPSKVLSEKSYKSIKLEDLSEKDKEVGNKNALTCSVCCETVASQLTAGKDVVQVNCVSEVPAPEGGKKELHGNHVFCKECIEESYHYQQICPACRGEIRPFK